MWDELILLAGLLILSGFFSGAETAFFSLDRMARTQMQQRGGLSALAARLAEDLHALLLVILFGNMVVNVSFFSISFSLGMRAGGGTALVGVAALGAVIGFGEVLPKLIAARAPVFIARIFALPLYLFGRSVRPITGLLARLPGARALPVGERYVTTEELKMLVEMSEQAGQIDAGEGELIREVVELADVRVTEAMVPRVDMVGFELPGDLQQVLHTIRETGISKVVAWEGTRDNILGYVDGKDLLLETGTDLRALLHPVGFVPETKKVDDLLREFIGSDRRFAVVVDEYGGTEGIVTLEHLLEQIVGQIEEEGGPAPEPPVIEQAPGRYLLRGNLSIRDWKDLFDIDASGPPLGTIAGLVTGLLGHLPRRGDTARYGNLLMTVAEVRGRRVTKILIESSSLSERSVP